MSGSDKSLHRKDFVKASEAAGFEFAKRLDRKADIAQIVKEFMDFKGPAFLEVIIDPNAGVYPGSGQASDKMIKGDFTVGRNKPSEDTPGPSKMF